MTDREWAQSFWERYWWELTDKGTAHMPRYFDRRKGQDRRRTDLAVFALVLALIMISMFHIGFRPIYVPAKEIPCQISK